MKKYLILLLLFTTQHLVSCRPDDPKPCSNTPEIKSVKQTEGYVIFLENRYAIRSHIPGTIDAVDIGFTCNLPDSLKKEGLRVHFDGVYYAYDQNKPASFAGTEYYYLVVENVAKSTP